MDTLTLKNKESLQEAIEAKTKMINELMEERNLLLLELTKIEQLKTELEPLIFSDFGIKNEINFKFN